MAAGQVHCNASVVLLSPYMPCTVDNAVLLILGPFALRLLSGFSTSQFHSCSHKEVINHKRRCAVIHCSAYTCPANQTPGTYSCFVQNGQGPGLGLSAVLMRTCWPLDHRRPTTGAQPQHCCSLPSQSNRLQVRFQNEQCKEHVENAISKKHNLAAARKQATLKTHAERGSSTQRCQMLAEQRCAILLP